MSQLRLAFSNLRLVPQPINSKRSKPSPVVLTRSQLLSWKIEKLEALRPVALDVLERQVDDMLHEAERRRG